MTKGLFGKLNHALEHTFPEKRLFLKSHTTTRFVRLKPATQVVALTGGAAMLGWSVFASATVVMDTIGADSLREQAAREQAVYAQRLNDLAAQRDTRTKSARRAQARFATALREVSQMQTALLASEERREELETGIEVIQATLRETMDEREAALAAKERLMARLDEAEAREDRAPEQLAEARGTVDILSTALSRTATERDALAGLAAEQETQIDELTLDAQLTAERDQRIFSRLEEAVTVSMEPLDKMFEAVGFDPEELIGQIRRGYERDESLGTISISTKGGLMDANAQRANGILEQLDAMALYNEAARKAPFVKPLETSYVLTSGFGRRWGRMHEGMDMAGAHGSAVLATADGVVTYAGRMSGYGKAVKIRHAFGTETLYGHNSELHVEVGQRVSRGDRIADMGNTGHSTGTHLHYEVRVDGRPVDPMSYIKAARDVF